MSTSRPAAEPAGRYLARVYISTFPTTSDAVDIFSATVVYIDASGVEHATGYDHSRVRLSLSEAWPFRKAAYRLVASEIDAIAKSYQAFLTKSGVRFELTHPSWWAPGVEEQPPYWADEDDQNNLLAA